MGREGRVDLEAVEWLLRAAAFEAVARVLERLLERVGAGRGCGVRSAGR